MKKGLARLIFIIVFLIPVVWYLFLQLFGSNSFSLAIKGEISSACGDFESVVVLTKTDLISVSKQNYLDRVRFATEKKSVLLASENAEFFECVNEIEADLILVDERGLWGSYALTRDGVDQLLTELDILILEKSYGKGAER